MLVIYLSATTAWGAWLGRGARSGEDYFLGGRELPWTAVLLSVVATETSTLTFLSIPGVAYGGTLGFLQIALGYVVGRTVVAAWLLPAYRAGRLQTAYELLEGRFGIESRRFASAIFMVTRLLSDSVRLFATAIPLTLITGWSLLASVFAIGALTFIYTYLGGIRAVVLVDSVQMTLYMIGGVVAIVVLDGLVAGGWPEILRAAGAAGKLELIDTSLDFGRPYTLWAGLLGGAFLSMGSHGVDQLIVQRLLTCRDLAASRRALVGSGLAVLGQFALFLMVGLGLWAYYEGRAFPRSDEIFATFIIETLPVGVRGVLIAGVFAAAMSTLSSSINALASATAYDFWRPARPAATERDVLRVGRFSTVIWTALLVAAAVGFIPLSRESATVEVALGIASIVYGGLLGAFALGRFSTTATQHGVNAALAIGIASVTVIWVVARQAIAWPWFVLIGTAITVVTGLLATRVAR
ncbi:MAG: sodium:solute symporter [Gemmatimonadetes bacterium]|nr:sodium:solute symporter [Gemmatimonadota bacterium]